MRRTDTAETAQANGMRRRQRTVPALPLATTALAALLLSGALASTLPGQQSGSPTPSQATPAPASSDAPPPTGAALFHEKGCEYCHGIGGVGTERGPSLLGVGKKLTALEISTQIKAGGGAMPAFGDVLTGPEVDALIAYLETLHKPSPPTHKRLKPSGNKSAQQMR